MKKLALIFVLVFCLPLFLFGCEETPEKNFYEIEVTVNEEAMTLSCSEKVCYVNTSNNALNEVDFYLYANSFNEGQKAVSQANFLKAYPNGESFGRIEICSVFVGQIEVEFLFEEPNKNILIVPLNKQLYPDEKVNISIEFEIILANINHRLGYGENTINCGNFFPIACVYENGFVKNGFASNGDPFYSDVSDFDVIINYPKDYIVASSGIQEKVSEGRLRCKGENIRDFCFVLSKKFEVISQKVGDVTVNYYYYDQPNPEKFLQISCEAVKTFSDLFGAYPYNQLSVVKTNFCFGGMEYPNLVMIADDITDEQTINYVIVHEIAHQWWYGMVGNNEFEEAWVDEGLTEYSTALFFEKEQKYGFKYDTVIDNAFSTYKNFVQIYSSILGDVEESMNRDLSEFETEPEYVNCTYTKGMLLFDSLREALGKRKFEKCLKNYLKDYKYKNSSYAKMLESFSKSAGRNLQSLFEAYVEGTVVVD